MSRPSHRSLAAPLGLALIALLAFPLAAFANTSEPIAQTGGMTVTLPMPGSGLSVSVKLDVVGNVSQVDLDPVGTYTATTLGPHAVTFDDVDGTNQVKINAKKDKLEVKAKAPTLASFLGAGTWSADLFGTGEVTTVAYSIGDSGGGAPTIAIDSVLAPADVAVVQGTPKMKTGPKHADASVKVTFSRDGFTKKLDIKVSVKTAGDHPASLKITLSGKDKQKLTGSLADLLGAHAWSGHACDGSAIGFGYEVLADGTAVFGAATGPLPATAKPGKHGFSVKFEGSKTKVKVKLHEKKDGTWELKVDGKADKCKHTPAADPTVNTPVAPNAKRGHGHGHGHEPADASKRDARPRG